MPRKWLVRLAWMVAGGAALYGALALAAGVSGGPLDPPYPPTAGTMKTIDSIAPSWFQILDSTDGPPCTNSRFYCVMGDNAVLDRETGLVWERDAGTNVGVWSDAVIRCQSAEIGGRKGWRLPTIAELASLIDMTGTGLKLPDGHPFLGLATLGASDAHWSITEDIVTPGASVRAVHFVDGSVLTWDKAGSPAQIVERAMCVRGADPG